MMKATLNSRIPFIIGELKSEVREGVKESAEKIADGARARVPVASGDLRDAIHVDDTGEAISVVAGNEDVFHGHMVENGTVRTPPQPFLLPAFEAERESLLDTVADHLRDI